MDLEAQIHPTRMRYRLPIQNWTGKPSNVFSPRMNALKRILTGHDNGIGNFKIDICLVIFH